MSDMKPRIAILLLFSILCIAYFLPGGTLSGFLPSGVVRFRIAYPVAVLFLGGLLTGLDWRFALAFLFSCTGDAFGAGGSFIGQMGFFALAHITLIWCFVRRLRAVSTSRATAGGCLKVVPDGQCMSAGATREGTAHAKIRIRTMETWWVIIGLAAIAAILILALTIVLPSIEDSVLVWGCGIYALLICTMASLAMLQRSPFFALGALLFAVSDFILSWNKFVGSVPLEKYLIMLPYYFGQALLWLGAVKVIHKSRR